MAEHARSDRPDRQSPGPRQSPGLPQRAPARYQSPAQALMLQRTIGNRSATRILSRWTAHPDKDKKGVLMPDPMATEFLRFNPPLSK